MILGKITDSQRYEALHPKFKQLFDFIKNHNLLEMELGRIELDGENLFINNVEPTLMKKENQALEVHQKYIDVHFPLSGEEIYGWSAIEDLGSPREKFDVENDFALYDEKAKTYFTLRPGEFLIVYPEDAHAPIIGKGKFRKAIAKVKL